MHSYYEESAWQTARIIGPGTSPKIVYGPTLLENEPAIAVFMEQAAGRVDEDPEAVVDPNDIRIVVSIAKPDGNGGWTWHEPVEYAAHPEVAYTGFDVVLDDQNLPVVMWLGYDVADSDEDSDLYYYRRALTSDDLGMEVMNFSVELPPLDQDSDDFFYFNEKPDELLYFAAPGDIFHTQASEICRDFKVAYSDTFTLLKLGDNQPAILKRLFGANEVSIIGGWGGEANLREGKAAGRIDLDLKFLYDKKTGEGIFATGQGRVNAGWKLNRDSCRWEFKNVTASAGVRVRSRVAIPNLSFSLGPVADIAVGIQVDGTFQGNFEWEQIELLPSFGSFSLETGVGGYAVGSAIGGALSLTGSLTGNLKIEADRDGVELKDIFIKGTVEGKVGIWKRTHEFKYSLLDDAPTSALPRDDLISVLNDSGNYVRTYTTPEGWDITETGVRDEKLGTGSVYSLPGVAESVVSDVASDLRDQGPATLFETSGGMAAGIWIRENGQDLTVFSNELMYSEFDGANWATPIALPGITGANREVQAIRDSMGQLIVVFAHADMSSLDGDSTDEQAFEAYETADICFIRQTESGWTAPQLLGELPGMATGLQLHLLSNGDLYLTWLEVNGVESELYIRKWDAANMLWLSRQLLSDGPVSASPAMEVMNSNPFIVWAENVPSESDADDFLGGSILCQATLSNGSWSEKSELQIPFDDFFVEAGSQGGEASLFSSDLVQPSNIDLSFFDLNNYVPVTQLCCDEEPEDVPELNVPEIDIPDSRQWPGVVGSFDPNDKFGANGFGPEGFIPGGIIIPYTVLFENDPEEGATAPALRVTITDQLDPDFDYSTFEFLQFGWGELSLDAPEGSQAFETMVDYENGDGSPLIVKVDAEFDPETGAITFVFDSIDPDTGTTPLGAFDGFLQVEEGDGLGEGFFTYRVQQKSDLPDGTEFRNIANIVFDVNDPIVTPEAVHTIDLVKPSSSASSPATSASSTFTVTLSGDDGSGSGIAFYNVYRSINGGSFSLWKAATTETSLEFSGETGKSYSFYSVATDYVGLVEDKAATAETTTFVDGIIVEIADFDNSDGATYVFEVTLPEANADSIGVEASDLESPVVWTAVQDVTAVKIGTNRYRIEATLASPMSPAFFRVFVLE
ncbi:MAG: hypothetical protein AAGB46_00465 [Verrucomicrobiota bacterium]